MASAPCVVIADYVSLKRNKADVIFLATHSRDLSGRGLPWTKLVVGSSAAAQMCRGAAVLCCHAGKFVLLLPVHGIWHRARHAPVTPACKQPGISKHKHRPCGIC